MKLLNNDFNSIRGLADSVKHPAVINSTCVVFAESEIIGLLSQKAPRGNIFAGVLKALASRSWDYADDE